MQVYLLATQSNTSGEHYYWIGCYLDLCQGVINQTTGIIKDIVHQKGGTNETGN